jgi:hypothetical protein
MATKTVNKARARKAVRANGATKRTAKAAPAKAAPKTGNGVSAAVKSALTQLGKDAETERKAYDAKVAAIVSLYGKGVGITELAEVAGMSTAGVRRIVTLNK